MYDHCINGATRTFIAGVNESRIPGEVIGIISPIYR